MSDTVREQIEAEFKKLYNPSISDIELDEHRGENMPIIYLESAIDLCLALIHQHTTAARVDELKWARDMAEKDITGHALISENYINQRIATLQAEQEGK